MESNQSNSNTQVNGIRSTFNDKVSRLRILGGGRRIAWNDRRRNRSI